MKNARSIDPSNAPTADSNLDEVYDWKSDWVS
jgi:hypothetical protein